VGCAGLDKREEKQSSLATMFSHRSSKLTKQSTFHSPGC
jgi:hypothetical protein